MAIGSIFRVRKISGAVVNESATGRFRGIAEPFDQRREVQAEIRNSVMDIILVGLGLLFFALSLVYVKACDRI